MVRKIIAIAIGGFIAIAVAHGFTEIFVEENQKHKKPTNRGVAYFLCVVFVFVASILWGAIVASLVYPGDEQEWSGRVATEYRPGKSLYERDEIIKTPSLLQSSPH